MVAHKAILREWHKTWALPLKAVKCCKMWPFLANLQLLKVYDSFTISLCAAVLCITGYYKNFRGRKMQPRVSLSFKPEDNLCFWINFYVLFFFTYHVSCKAVCDGISNSNKAFFFHPLIRENHLHSFMTYFHWFRNLWEIQPCLKKTLKNKSSFWDHSFLCVKSYLVCGYLVTQVTQSICQSFQMIEKRLSRWAVFFPFKWP